MIVLGLETSCDETAAAVVSGDRKILSNVVYSQLKEHAPYGGVVPEIASRAHIQTIDDVITRAMKEAGVAYADLDGVAATSGPGLIGGVIVGLMMGKSIAAAANKPFLGVNHLEGHALTARLTDDVPFPFLLLLVSGGHCQLLSVEAVGKYTLLGTTIDDAIGEAFDKTAKMLGMGYPGGPAVEKAAKDGDEKAFPLPRPLRGKPGCDFSFAGLKTAVWRTVTATENAQARASDICASFQSACGDILADRVKNALAMFREQHPSGRHLVIAGGVAANQYLRCRLETITAKVGFTLVAPPLKLCTDNAAMIAWAGLERLKLGLTDGLDVKPRARWPLAELSA